jgi:hypothetical protein
MRQTGRLWVAIRVVQTESCDAPVEHRCLGKERSTCPIAFRSKEFSFAGIPGKHVFFLWCSRTNALNRIDI